MDGCKEDLKKAIERSSLKGLPRIISAPNLFHRILWAVAFITLLSICLTTVSMNISAYLEYPKVMNVEEKPIDHLDPNGTVPFPTIAVCNSNHFGSNISVYEQNGIPLPADYYKKVYNMTQCEGCTEDDQDFSKFLKGKLMTFRGYYQYVGREAIVKISNNYFVLICVVLVYSGGDIVSFPCENTTTSYTFMHPYFGVCTAYEAQLSSQGILLGYSFTFHLESTVDNLNTEYDPEHWPQPTAGAQLLAFDPYITPHVQSGWATAGPGKATDVNIKIIRTDRLSKPYSDRECIDADTNEKYVFDGQHYDYDAITCESKCNMAYCEKECNCTNLFMLQNPEDGPPKYEYCASGNQSINDLYKNMLCSELTKTRAFPDCHHKCKDSCKEIKYVLRTATTKWPLPSQIASFYKNVIQNNPILYEKYSQYEDVARGMALGSKNVSELEKLLISKTIEENFAYVTIFLDDAYYTHYESKVKTSICAFISQLGGSLNLWSGITVVLVVEIIDFILKIVGRMAEATKKPQVIKVAPVRDIFTKKGDGAF